MDPVTAIFILILFFGLLRRSKAKKVKIEQEITPKGVFPYVKKTNFLSDIEMSFLHLFESVVGAQYVIYCKVNMSSLIAVKKNISDSAKPGYLKKINTHFVDYVLCEPTSLTPICAINLEKRARVRKESIKYEQFLNETFKAASLPLVHFKTHYSYNENEVISHLLEYIELEIQLPFTHKPSTAV